ncbi:MAG TPA: TRAP transporter large permease [Spirochaetales bacterium]|nr:TRAP transporter large permease [Spirochaetales bacterium]HOV38043.1 TRAP transporter large permease [Spirochaetales bacterium]
MIALLFITLFILLGIGAPIAIALGGSSMLWVYLSGTVSDYTILHRIVNGMDSFPLLAIPFFIMAGTLMNETGLTNQIYNFANALVGWLPGGLGHVNIGGSVIFAGMSGTAVADAGGLGTIEIKAMTDAGYDLDFSLAVTAASSTIGPIIPPSLPMVIYGVMASASIGRLFIAGFVPGILMAIAMSVLVAYYAKKRNYPRDTSFSLRRLGKRTIEGIPALITPIIIIGGIMSGVFTPTEAAIAAVAYALILSLIYKTLTLKKLVAVSLETAETTAVILLIVGCASIFAWVLTVTQTTEKFAMVMLSLSNNKYVVLLIINLILLVVGCFMETIAAITILTPVFLPVITNLGIDPVHFGVIMVFNLMIGLLTPPVGMVLFVLARVTKVPFERVAKATAPFLIPLLAVLILISVWEPACLWLPNLVFNK